MADDRELRRTGQHLAPSAAAAGAQVSLEVRGQPARAQVTLLGAQGARYVLRTDDAGRGYASGIRAGLYQCLVQRSGQAVQPPKRVIIGSGACALVIGA